MFWLDEGFPSSKVTGLNWGFLNNLSPLEGGLLGSILIKVVMKES